MGTGSSRDTAGRAWSCIWRGHASSFEVHAHHERMHKYLHIGISCPWPNFCRVLSWSLAYSRSKWFCRYFWKQKDCLRTPCPLVGPRPAWCGCSWGTCSGTEAGPWCFQSNGRSCNVLDFLSLGNLRLLYYFIFN